METKNIVPHGTNGIMKIVVALGQVISALMDLSGMGMLQESTIQVNLILRLPCNGAQDALTHILQLRNRVVLKQVNTVLYLLDIKI